MSTETETLRAILQEFSQLREEQKIEREQMQTEMRLRDETLHRLEKEINQINRSNNISVYANKREIIPEQNDLCASLNTNLGYKLKPDTFDGTGSLREFFIQLNLIAWANNWIESMRTVVLASSLKGKARSVLDCVEIENL